MDGKISHFWMDANYLILNVLYGTNLRSSARLVEMGQEKKNQHFFNLGL
jgi:hypothetical protein